jgi:hypothetical protein
MGTNPVSPNLTGDKVTAIVGTITAVVSAIEQVVAASGVGASLNLNMAQIEQLTALFGNLAGVAIQAAHQVLGRQITPESVLALMPGNTPLAAPAE